MINAFRAEWVRLLRARTLLAVAIPLAFFPALVTVLTFAAGTGTPGPGSHLTVSLSDLTASDGYLVGIDPAATVIGGRVPIWVRVSVITGVVLVGVLLSTMLLAAGGVGDRGGSGGGHGSGDETE